MGDKRENVRSAHLKRAHISRPFLSQTLWIMEQQSFIQQKAFHSQARQLSSQWLILSSSAEGLLAFPEWQPSLWLPCSRVSFSTRTHLSWELLWCLATTGGETGMLTVPPPPACRYQMIIWSAKREHSDVDFPESVGFLCCPRKERHKHCAGEMAKSGKCLSSKAQGSKFNPQSPHLKKSNRYKQCSIEGLKLWFWRGFEVWKKYG